MQHENSAAALVHGAQWLVVTVSVGDFSSLNPTDFFTLTNSHFPTAAHNCEGIDLLKNQHH